MEATKANYFHLAEDGRLWVHGQISEIAIPEVYQFFVHSGAKRGEPVIMPGEINGSYWPGIEVHHFGLPWLSVTKDGAFVLEQEASPTEVALMIRGWAVNLAMNFRDEVTALTDTQPGA